MGNARALQAVYRRPDGRFMPGVSGNPQGKRLGQVSIKSALLRALSRAEADKIARRIIALAKRGDAAIIKVLLDRIDGPLNGPLAEVLLQVQSTEMATVRISCNHRDHHSPELDKLTVPELEKLVEFARQQGALGSPADAAKEAGIHVEYERTMTETVKPVLGSHVDEDGVPDEVPDAVVDDDTEDDTEDDTRGRVLTAEQFLSQ
jgi:hypothetical protein